MTQPHHSPTDAPATTPLRVWDLPTRLFHWLLVLCVIGLVVTAEVGDALMVWHFRLGYTVFTLLLFRLVWGFVGGHWSRFAQFLYSPKTIWAYARSQSHAQERPGHNPLGSLSVWALLLLLLLLLQVATGLMSDDEISNAGPWVPLVSGAVSALATTWHSTWGKLALIVLVLLHVSAIAYYKKRKGRDLLGPMLTGDAPVAAATPPWPASRDRWAQRLWALLILLGCALLVRQLVNWAG